MVRELKGLAARAPGRGRPVPAAGPVGGGATSYWQARDLCSSGIGILGSALSGSFASSCSTINLIWAGSLLAIGVGVVLLLSGLFARGQAPHAPAPRLEWPSSQIGLGPAASLPATTGGRTYPAWTVLLGVAALIAVWGAMTRPSRCCLVFLDEATEAIASADLGR